MYSGVSAWECMHRVTEIVELSHLPHTQALPSLSINVKLHDQSKKRIGEPGDEDHS